MPIVTAIYGAFGGDFWRCESVIFVGFAWILLGFRAVKTGDLLGLRLCYLGF